MSKASKKKRIFLLEISFEKNIRGSPERPPIWKNLPLKDPLQFGKIEILSEGRTQKTKDTPFKSQ